MKVSWSPCLATLEGRILQKHIYFLEIHLFALEKVTTLMQLTLYRGRFVVAAVIVGTIITHLPEQSLLHKAITQNVRSNLCHPESYRWQHFVHLSQ